MIILKDINEFKQYIRTQKELLEYIIKSQEYLKNIILNYMQNFADSTEDIDVSLIDNVLSYLDALQESLNLCNKNIKNCDSLVSDLSKLDFYSTDKHENYNNFYKKLFQLNKKILQNTFKIEECIYSISKNSKLNFSNNDIAQNALKSDITQNILAENKINISADNSKESKDDIDGSSIINAGENFFLLPSSIENGNYLENTLIVSEPAGCVILPYKIFELNEILKNNGDKYSSMKDIIIANYTMPISVFKNPFIARFREAFKLVRNKENGSIKEAFDLGLELMFNYNLHPAIISACRNLDELDIYLDYLDNGEIEKYNCFKIIFELPPAIVK